MTWYGLRFSKSEHKHWRHEAMQHTSKARFVLKCTCCSTSCERNYGGTKMHTKLSVIWLTCSAYVPFAVSDTLTSACVSPSIPPVAHWQEPNSKGAENKQMFSVQAHVQFVVSVFTLLGVHSLPCVSPSTPACSHTEQMPDSQDLAVERGLWASHRSR